MVEVAGVAGTESRAVTRLVDDARLQRRFDYAGAVKVMNAPRLGLAAPGWPLVTISFASSSDCSTCVPKRRAALDIKLERSVHGCCLNWPRHKLIKRFIIEQHIP